MITTTQDLLEAIKSFKIGYFSTYEDITKPFETRITFFRVRWFCFILKYRIRKAINYIENNKPAVACFKYKNLSTTGI